MLTITSFNNSKTKKFLRNMLFNLLIRPYFFSMNIVETHIIGLFTIEPKIVKDELLKTTN